MEIKILLHRLALILFSVILMGVTVNAATRDWKKVYNEDRYGDPIPSEYGFLTFIPGTVNGNVNLMSRNASSQLSISVMLIQNNPIPEINLYVEGYHENFMGDNVVVITLANGKRFDIPTNYDAATGGLILGTSPQHWRNILDILNKGNFKITIKSENLGYDEYMKCVFNAGNITTGITSLVRGH